MSQSTELKVTIGLDTFEYHCPSRVLGAAFTSLLHETFALDNLKAYDALQHHEAEWIGGIGLRSYAYICDMAYDARQLYADVDNCGNEVENDDQWLLIEITRRD